MPQQPEGIIELLDEPTIGQHIHLMDGRNAKIATIDTAARTCVLDVWPVTTMLVQYQVRRDCPDGGICHHTCTISEACFRVGSCGPLSGVFPNNQWPTEIVEQNR